MALLHWLMLALAGLSLAEFAPRNVGDGGETSTAHTPSPTAVQSPSSTAASPPSATSTAGSGGYGGPTSSPLLFFVALGFGVVFTNLWIIVGVKYCFRYNQRHRQARADEGGEPIDLAAMRRPPRRRREKKLMSMEEVNNRFPLIKYKTWRAGRESAGLPSAGGVTSSPSRAASIKDAEGISGAGDTSKSIEVPRPGTAASNRSHRRSSHLEITRLDELTMADLDLGHSENEKSDVKDVETTTAQMSTIVETKTNTSTLPETPTHAALMEEEEEEEDDHIHTAVPPEMLTNPGDSCAICLDNLDDEDDVRGLTCGHAFHASCLDPWLTSRRACCPLCKADYYVPKPRPEGEVAHESERASRHRSHGTNRHRAALPAVPQSAWSGRRGNGFTSRLGLPNRFVSPPDHERYGFPALSRERRRPRTDANATIHQ
ncbi:MAG: hypothetical protein M1838_000217, partial [Thelocarpon superellum]